MKKRRIGKFLLIVALFLVVVIVGAYALMNRNLGKLAESSIENVDVTVLSDGEYLGRYRVLPVIVELKVTVKNHAIESIQLLRHDNGQGKMAEKIVDDVIAQQRIDVDSVAGATYSSKVILKAIEAALK